MSKRWSYMVRSIISLILITGAVVAQQQQQKLPIKPPIDEDIDASDPDVPAFLKSKIDKLEYMKMRSAHIGRLRGLPYKTNYDPRARALEMMDRQIKSSGPQIFLNGITWTAVGPAPIPNGQTNSVSVAVSGRVTCIAIHPSDPNTAYVGTAGGGLYRTLDGGSSWTQLMDNAQTLAIGAIAIDPVTPTTLFVGTGESNQSLDSYWGVGLYVIQNANAAPTITGPFNTRTNGGNGFALSGCGISSIVVNPNNNNQMWIATTSGISANQGQGGGANAGTIGLYFCGNAQNATPTFQLVTGLPTGVNVTDIVMEPGVPNNMCVGLSGNAAIAGVYRSTDATTGAGSAWTRTLALTPPASAPLDLRLAIHKSGAVVTIYAATGESNTGVLRQSADGGQTWPTTLAAANGYCTGQCWYDLCVAVDQNDVQTIYLGGSAPGGSAAILKRSIDGGTTFANIDNSLHADAHAIAIAPSNSNIVYFGCDGGVWRSTNKGTNWTSMNNAGFNATQFQSVAVHPSNANFSIGGTQDNGTNWYQPAGTWNRCDWGDGGYALIDQNAPDVTNVTMYHTYFSSNQAGNAFIGFARVTTTANASDGNWTVYGCASGGGVTANGLNCTDNVLFYAPMALGPGNPNTLYFGTDRLYRAPDQGVTMSLVSQGPLSGGSRISTIAISPQNDNVRIVGLENGQVWATTTGSSTMTNVTNGGFPSRYVGRVAIDPNNSNTAYACFAGYGDAAGQHIWRTTNLSGGAGTWVAAGGTGANVIPDVPVNAFKVDPQDSNVLYAGTDIGMYRSTDAGVNWFPFNNGLPRVAIFDIAIQNSNRILRIATHGRGLWELSINCALTCPANVTQSTDPNLCGAVVNYPTPTNLGVCGTITCIPASGSFFPKGTTLVTCTATAGPTCSFNVTVNDTQPPFITCPANVVQSNDPNQCGAVVNYAAPTVTDNCPGVGAPVCVPATGSFFPKGTTIVSCSVSDAVGNSATCSFNVTVNDTQPPSITCPANITKNTDPNLCTAVTTWAAPAVSDNCPGVGAPTCNPASGFAFPKGVTTVTCSVTDASANTSTCTFTVTVNDVQPPTITCPANIAVESDQTCNGATVNYPAPAVWDNCPGVTYVCNPPSGSYFPAGNPIQVTTVTCTAKDASNNTASCSFTISVEKRPIITPQVTTIVFSFGCKIKTPITKNIVITNTGGHFAGGVLAWNATTAATEITSLTSGGVEGNAMSITVNPGLLANGNYTRTITLTGKNSVTNAVACNSPLTVNVIIIIESNLPTTQTKTVTNAWTQFTNGLGQVMAEMKSNAGNISSVTMNCYPCTYPPNGLSRNRFSKRYYRWTSSAPSLNVDMKLYFNGAELSMVTNPSIMQVYQQPVLGGTWYNRGGATDIFLNTVTATGLTSIAGNFASATIWTIPKRMSLHVLQASYDRATKSANLIFRSEITPDENGFVIERADALDAEVWSQAGSVSFEPKHGYQFTEKIAQGGMVYYRISAIDSEGELVESEPIAIETGIGEGMFALEQNYPNPFEAGSRPTMIGYRLGEVTHVTLKVYDALMREVATLVDEEQSSGRYEARFEASHLPSGVYFYQLVAGKFSQIKKMTLTR